MTPHDHVVLGALTHDTGKFWERAERLDEYRRNELQKQLDCPLHRDGYRSHLHVLNSRRFGETLADRAPFLQPQTGDSPDHWLNLAARHHVASTPLEQLIEAADHFASAEREQGDYYQFNIHKRSRLESLLERVNLDGKNTPTRHRLPLAALALDDAALFPCPTEAFTPPMQAVGTTERETWLSPQPLLAEYRALADGFLTALAGLPTHAHPTPEALPSLLTTLLAQMERFMSSVPAATNVLHPDISLFDHLRVTAAIAEGLYLHHEAEGTLDQPVQFRALDIPKWRLVCGDFSGIQNFIYGISRAGAARALRGRSFYIQLLCDGVSEHLLRTLGLSPTARIYSSGGKFYLLIPDCREAPLKAEVAAINRELLTTFQGKVFLGIGIAPVCGRDFSHEQQMGPRWKEAHEALMRDRQRRFSPLLTDPAFFAPQALHPGPACSVCGRDDAAAAIREREDGAVCGQCWDLMTLGKTLTAARYLFWAWGADRPTAAEQLRGHRPFTLPGVPCDLYLLESPPHFGELRSLPSSVLETLNQIADPDGNPHGYACRFRCVGQWDRTKPSGAWEFSDFAQQAHGIDRLGVLRLDVDNLGEIFIRGLRFPAVGNPQPARYGKAPQLEMGSLSRVATLSRQLHLFFAGYLPTLLRPYDRTQIIYAGGDDVFLIGAWDELPAVARQIRSEFQRYCAGNPAFTLSGGLALVGGKYPISRAADLAGDAERAAKQLRRRLREKDAFCFLDTAIGWEEYPRAERLVADLQAIIAKTHHRAILARLRAVALAVDEYQRRRQPDQLSDAQFQELVFWQKWRWQLVYNLKRLQQRHGEAAPELDDLLQTILETRADHGRPALDWLALPTRWAEFLTRSKD